tara:strand:+ start:169 stop:675 length:507 start_codon:yes stop_codon:yes gene_type:complete
MQNTIVNKVSNSSLITIDLQDYKSKGVRNLVNISQWLEDGVLREKGFRKSLKEHNWTQYKDHLVALDCSADLILPSWATLLITTYLSPFAKIVILGSLNELEKHLFSKTIDQLDLEKFKGKPLIIKGCSDYSIPEASYINLIQRLQKVAKSIFYGEACSSVPLWKAKK